MKFSDKLFFATTALLTAIFTVFGIWMLSSYFQRILDREMEQGSTENMLFQYLFEMAYQSTLGYGNEYALNRAIDSAKESMEKGGSMLFVQTGGGEILYGEHLERRKGLLEAAEKVRGELTEENDFASGISNLESGDFLLCICESNVGADKLYLGICRDLTDIYEDRQSLLNQYRLALVLLLTAGGICMYLLSRYITRPIRTLGRVAGWIAAGNYEKRSKYKAPDEIGELAASFNRMADRLVEQMQEKELEAKHKEDFTAAFAHELKTPLTSIIGYADMLNSIDLSEEERREAYFYIYSQGKRLESLSHKLLELVSMEKQPMVYREVPIKKLEENIRTAMRPVWKQKNIKGKIVMEKGVIYGDYELLLSLFYNLLDNAMKAVPEGGFVLMKGRCLKENYEIKVVDNGRGIPKEEIHRITEAFYMVDKSRSRKEGGAGIGMALCQRIVSLHQGTLKIDSKLGDGTVVQICFPKSPSDRNKE